VNENVRRAVEALETGASEARRLSALSGGRVRDRVQRAIDEALNHLEAADAEPESIFDSLDRQSREIAEDLRRAERLMRGRRGED
jgi:hypothetical protein